MSHGSLGRVAAALVLATASVPAGAHPLAPSLLEVREGSAGRVDVRWRTPLLVPAGVELRPVLPPDCVVSSPHSITRDVNSLTVRTVFACAEEGLVGASLGVAGLAESGTDVLLRVELEDGRRLRQVLSAERTSWRIPERQAPLSVAASYLGLGFRHMTTGPDHLLFLLALLLLVRGVAALLVTVSAFTVGHSVTLCLAALGFVSFPVRVAELLIAVSVLALAVELARSGPAPASRSVRGPAIAALGFGLLHGLGFAGALTQVGLPPEEIPVALVSFNVGIELGQIAFVAGFLGLRRWVGPRLEGVPDWAARVPAYAIGTLAAWWCFQRVGDLL
jgi:hydrogenase/urease accessory protein HupE